MDKFKNLGDTEPEFVEPDIHITDPVWVADLCFNVDILSETLKKDLEKVNTEILDKVFFPNEAEQVDEQCEEQKEKKETNI